MDALQKWLDEQAVVLRAELIEEARLRGLMGPQADIRVLLRARRVKATVQVWVSIPAELQPVSPQREMAPMGAAAARYKHIRAAAFTPGELRKFLELAVQWPEQRGRGAKAYEALLKLLIEHGNNPTPQETLAPFFERLGVRSFINANLRRMWATNQKRYWLTEAPTDQKPRYEKSWQLWEVGSH